MNHGARQHALLSASGAYRWMSCTPSARLEDQEPESRSSYASEGTLAHEFAEVELRFRTGEYTKRKYNAARKKLIDSEDGQKYYSSGMDGYVNEYADYVMSKLRPGAELIIEHKMEIPYVPDGFGTNDAIIVGDGELEVIDLKYGQGIPVSAVDNPQLKLYAMGALHEFSLMYDIETVRTTVVQPRLDSISSWSLPVNELNLWAVNEVRVKASLAHHGEGEFVSGDHCKFCKIKHKCRKLHDDAMESAKHDFASPETLTDDEILDVYEQIGLFRDWLNAVENYVFEEAKNGKKWEGYKIVEGRSNRKWADEEKVFEALRAAGYKVKDIQQVKLQTITNITKLLGKDKFESVLGELVYKPEGAPTLVPESDKREEFHSAINDFKDFSNE